LQPTSFQVSNCATVFGQSPIVSQNAPYPHSIGVPGLRLISGELAQRAAAGGAKQQ
jgi:hypothetical protein